MKTALSSLLITCCFWSLATASSATWQTIEPGTSQSDFSREPTRELVNPDFSGGLTGWEILSLEGAEGRWRLHTHEGIPHLSIQKTNGRGMILVRSRQPVAAEAAEKFMLRAFYQSADAPQSSAFLARLEKAPGNLNYDENAERGTALGAQRTLINTSPGQWTPFLHEVRGGRLGKVFVNLIVEGNPYTVNIREVNLEPYEQADQRWKETNQHAPRPTPDWISREQMLEHLEQLPALEARLERIQGATTLLINGKPAPPVFYKENPGLPQYHLGGSFLESGVGLQLVNTSFRHRNRPSTNIWTGHQRYDFEAGFESIELALRGAPEAQIVLDLQLDVYQGWEERYPDQLWQNEEGKKLIRIGGHHLGFGDELSDVGPENANKTWHYSYFSPVWRQEIKEALRAYLEALRQTPYAKRVVGVMISGGRDGQFAMVWPDHSPHARKYFARWLAEKYGTPEALSAAWNIPLESFEAAAIPDLRSGKFYNQNEHDWIYDPSEDQALIDYQTFRHETLAEFHDEIAQLCKEVMAKDILAIRYFMAGFGNSMQSTLAVHRKILSSPYIDAIAPQPSYGLRKPGKALVMRQALESFHLHNKLVITEFDHRTWLRTMGHRELIHLAWSYSYDLDDFQQVQRKIMGASIARGHGFWYYDMVAGWYHDPGIQQAVQRDLPHYARAHGKQNWKADVALIVDEETSYHLPTISGIGHPSLARGLSNQILLASTSGVPHDIYYFEDLASHAELENYRVLVFLCSFRITAEQRAQLERLKGGNRTLVWVYAPGYSDGSALREEHMAEVTGMTLRSAGRQGAEPVYLGNTEHPLTEGLYELQGRGYLDRMAWRRDRAATGIDSPQFYVDDPQAEVLARYGYSERPAIAVRQFPEWRSIYIAEPGGIGNDLLNRIARTAGAYVLTDPDISTEMNNRFISVHGLRSGRYLFNLPREATVYDLNSGKRIASDVREFDYEVEAGKSYWFGID